MKRSLCSFIEPLEARIAPAGLVTATLAGGKLILTGDADDNALNITVPAPGSITITGMNGTTIAFNGDPAAAVVMTSLPVLEIAATMARGSDFIGLTGVSLGKGLKFDGGADGDRLDLTDTVIDGTLTFLGGADADSLNTLGTRFHAGKVIADLGTGTNGVAPAATNSTVAGDFIVKGGPDADGFFITSAQFRVGGNLVFNGAGGDDSVSIASTYVGVDRSLVLSFGTHTMDLSHVIFTPTLSVGGDLAITTGKGAKNDFTFTNNTDLTIGGKMVLKGGDSVDKFNFLHARASFLGGVNAALGGGDNNLEFNGSASTFFGSMKYSGGSGVDGVDFNSTPEITIAGAVEAKLGDGANVFLLTPANLLSVGGGVKVSAGVAADTVNVESATLEVRKGIALALSEGNATVSVKGTATAHVSGSINIAAGAGAADTENINLTFGDALITGGVSLKSSAGAFTNNVTASGTLAITGDYRVAATGDGIKAINFSSAQLRLGGVLDLKGGNTNNDFDIAPGPYEIGKVKIQGGVATDVFKLTGDGQVAGLVEIQLGAGGNNVEIKSTNGATLSGGLKIVSTSLTGDAEVVTLNNLILPSATNIKLGAGFGTVKLDDITAAGTVLIDTGAGADTVTFESVDAGINSTYFNSVKVLLGDDNDTVNLGITAATHAGVNIFGPLFVDGGAGVADVVNQNNTNTGTTGSINSINVP